MIIGLTGSFAAGKDAVANYLVSKGFSYHSYSDLLREELRKKGLTVTRENLRQEGNSMRKEYGAAELSKRIYDLIQKTGEANSLMVSVRNPEEVRFMKKVPGYRLWFVNAPSRIRYERSRKRARTDDFSSLEEFLEFERRENSTNPDAQQLATVAAMADKEIINDKDLPALHKTIDELLKETEHHLIQAA